MIDAATFDQFDEDFFVDAAHRPGDPSPAVPKQLRIIRKLAAYLEATSGAKCWVGKSVITAKEAGDTLSLLEAPRPIVGSGAGEAELLRNENWTLLLQGWPEDNFEEPSAPAYWMKAKCEQALSLIMAPLPEGKQRTDPLYRLDGEVSSLTIGQGVVRPPSEEAASRLAMFYLPLIIGLQTNARSPYA